MDTNLRNFRDILLWVFDTHEKPWEYKNNSARAIWDIIQTDGTSLNVRRAQLETLLPTDEDACKCFPPKQYLYLAPILVGSVIVPRLWLECDFGRSIPHVSLRVELFLLHQQTINVIGYRFETPEGLGVHNYYHLQSTENTSFPWIPTSQPAIALAARNPVELLFCLLISFYGRDYLEEIGRNLTFQKMPDYISDLAGFSSSDPVSWYWRIEDQTKADHRVYETVLPETEFRQHVQANFPGWKCSSISMELYKRAPGKFRGRIY